MKHLSCPKLLVENIVEDCAAKYRPKTRDGLQKKLSDSKLYLKAASNDYHKQATAGNWSAFRPHDMVNESIPKDDMCDVYDSKFVSNEDIRKKYYDLLMAAASNGKCPICGVGHVSTLDHYLAKTVYPTYAITPYNLVPVCKDCNTKKHDMRIDPECAPFHPYYEDIDSIIWLEADIQIVDDGPIFTYHVSSALKETNPILFSRLENHMRIYALARCFSIEAAQNFAENITLYKDKMKEWGSEFFSQYLSDSLDSQVKVQNNTWQTAYLRALIKNVDWLSTTILF